MERSCLFVVPDRDIFYAFSLRRKRSSGVRVDIASLYQCMGPWLDSIILTFSILAQFMLMGRRLENWYIWLAVNTLAVPLYATRELYLTAGLYLVFWFNAWHGLYQWRKEIRAQ